MISILKNKCCLFIIILGFYYTFSVHGAPKEIDLFSKSIKPTLKGLLPNLQEKQDRREEDAENDSALIDSLFEEDKNFEIPHPIVLEEKKSIQREGNQLNDSVKYYAKDSVIYDIENEKMFLYGNTEINYEKQYITANETNFDWKKSIISSTGSINNLGNLTGKPVFQQEDTFFLTDTIKYNFNNQKAIIQKAATKKDDGIINGERAKKDDKGNMYLYRAKYTTCNLTEPHFHIGLRRMKMVQDDKIVGGPWNLYFDNVPLPVGFLLAIFPLSQDNPSGFFLNLDTGEDSLKGFYIKNFGYFWKINEYINLLVSGGIYSRGSREYFAFSQYKKLYRYEGKIEYEKLLYNYLREQDEKGQKCWKFKWLHTPIQRRNSNIRMSIDLQNDEYQEVIEQDIPFGPENSSNLDSNVRYDNSLVGLPYNLNVAASYRKNLKNKYQNTVLPNIILATKSNIYPLRGDRNSQLKWYDDIHFRHRLEIKALFDNDKSEEEEDPSKISYSFSKKEKKEYSNDKFTDLFKNEKIGVKNTFPVTTNIKVFKYFNLAPYFNYTERWYFKKNNYYSEMRKNKIVIQNTEKGLKRVWDWNTGVSLSTVIYGTQFFNESAKLQALRYQMLPKITYNYSPDFSKKKFNYYQEISHPLRDKKIKQSKFKNNAVYGMPLPRSSSKISVIINNTLEAKIKKSKLSSQEDTPNFKLPLIEELSVQSGYDFMLDECPLDDIQVNYRNSFFYKTIQLQSKVILDPYGYRMDTNQKTLAREINRQKTYTWNRGEGIGKLSNFGLNLDLRLNSEIVKAKFDEKRYRERLMAKNKEEKKEFVPEMYMDFDIPWNLMLGYYYTYMKQSLYPKKINHGITWKGDLRVNEKWVFGFASGYDLQNKKILKGRATNISIKRDLHCWEMEFNWNPIPKNKQLQYEFSIRVKSNQLGSVLKYRRTR